MLAIIIPYYKFTFFQKTLQSLANQTDKRFKVYIGDDASLVDPKQLLEKYQDKFDFNYYRFPKNLGGKSLTMQWERCLDLAGDEEWVMVLGDDDTISDNFVEAFYTNLLEINEAKVNVIRYASVVINEYDKQISKIHKHPKLEKTTDFLMRKLQGGTRSSLSEFVFKKRVIDEVKFKNLPLAWYSDYLAVLECSNFGNMYTVNEALMSFRLSGLNITSRNDDLTQKNIATFNFYYYLINKKHVFFNRDQKETLYFMLEKTFLDNKKNIEFWFLFTKLYVGSIEIKRFSNFILKLLNTGYKKLIDD